MRREKLNIVTPAADAAEPGRYVLDDQVGFLLRVALQRHTSIFTTRMIEGMTQTQFAALAKLHEVGPCSQNHLGRLIYLDAATIKGVVDRLGAAGLLPPAPEPKDTPPPPRGGAHRPRPPGDRSSPAGRRRDHRRDACRV